MSYDPNEGTSPYLGMDPYTMRGDTTRLEDVEDGLVADTEAYDDFALEGTYASPASRTAETPRDMPTTIRRPQAVQDTRSLRRTSRPLLRPDPVPSPPQQGYAYDEPYDYGPRKPGPLNLLAAFLLSVAALALRLAAIGCAGIVVACAVLTGSRRAALIRALNVASELIPPSVFGRLVYETPFGGSLRGDLIIVALVLFVVDWLCLRSAWKMRHPAEY